MPSNYTGLGIQLMSTGEKAGTWGTLTNTNWDIIEQISGGYVVQTLNTAGTGANTTDLSVSDGSTGATLSHRAIILGAETPETITGNKIVTIPIDVQTFYIIKNSTSGVFTVEFKYITGSGASITWATGDKGYKILLATANDGTNPDIVDATADFVTADSTTTLTNKTLTAPKFADGGFIADAGGDETLVFGEVGTPVNELKITNAATGSGPILSSVSTSGTDTNIDINLNPGGTGVLKSGTAAVKIAGTETIFVPAQAMFGTTTNGADAQAVETTATRPEMKVLDFDPSTIEYAQFSIAMPKSWDEGTLTFQAFWSPSSTDTGAALIGLQGISVANDATSDVAFPTAVDVTDNGTGTVEDVLVSPVSAAVTVTSAAADTYTYFQVSRNATSGSDSFTGDVRLLGIKLFYTTDEANDG